MRCSFSVKNRGRLKVLLDRGADIEAKDTDGSTPLAVRMATKGPSTHRVARRMVVDEGPP